MLDSLFDDITRDKSYTHPLLLERFLNLSEHCKQINIDLVPTCTWRSEQQQDMLFQYSRTIPGVMITHDLGCNSGMCLVDKDGNPLSIELDYVATTLGKISMDFKKYGYVRSRAPEFGLETGIFNNTCTLYLPINDVLEYELIHNVYGDTENIKRLASHRKIVNTPKKKTHSKLDAPSYLA